MLASTSQRQGTGCHSSHLSVQAILAWWTFLVAPRYGQERCSVWTVPLTLLVLPSSAPAPPHYPFTPSISPPHPHCRWLRLLSKSQEALSGSFWASLQTYTRNREQTMCHVLDEEGDADMAGSERFPQTQCIELLRSLSAGLKVYIFCRWKL